MREQAAIYGSITTRRAVPYVGSRMGNLDGVDRGSLADHADQRGGDAGSWLSATLALRARYAGQSALAGAGAAGALGLVIAYLVTSGVGG